MRPETKMILFVGIFMATVAILQAIWGHYFFAIEDATFALLDYYMFKSLRRLE